MRLSKIDKLVMNGYYFSGIYETLHRKAIEKAAQKRKQGYLARTVFVPSSRYNRGHNAGGYSVYIKATKKKEVEIGKERVQKEKTKQDNLKAIRNYLSTRTGVELIELFKNTLKDDYLETSGESELLRWAAKEKII